VGFRLRAIAKDGRLEVGEAFAEVLAGAVDVAHGRSFGDLQDLGDFRVFHVLEGAKQQTGSGDIADGVEGVDELIVEVALIGGELAAAA